MKPFDKYSALHTINELCAQAVTPVDQLKLPEQMAQALQDVYNTGFENGFETCMETETPNTH